MGDVRPAGMQRRNRVGRVGDEREQEVGREPHGALVGEPKHVGEPEAVGAGGDERKAAARLGQAIGPEDAGEARMLEVGELAHPRAQRELEVGGARQLGAEAQQLERRTVGVVEEVEAIAQPIREARRIPREQGSRGGRVAGGPVHLLGGEAAPVQHAVSGRLDAHSLGPPARHSSPVGWGEPACGSMVTRMAPGCGSFRGPASTRLARPFASGVSRPADAAPAAFRIHTW